MPTRIRIDLAGYHHIINRGVDRMNVFRHDEDKEMFLQILNKASILHKIVLKLFTPVIKSPLFKVEILTRY